MPFVDHSRGEPLNSRARGALDVLGPEAFGLDAQSETNMLCTGHAGASRHFEAWPEIGDERRVVRCRRVRHRHGEFGEVARAAASTGLQRREREHGETDGVQSMCFVTANAVASFNSGQDEIVCGSLAPFLFP